MKCTHEGCDKEAVYTYAWPWGGRGACCEGHRVHVTQIAEQTGYPNQVSFSTIDPDRKPPVERDERVQYQARILVLEQECVEVKAHAGELNLKAENLANELRKTMGRVVALEQSLALANENFDQVVRERDEARASNADLASENAKLRLLAPLPPAEL
jgi:NTP pyrophosphatase (non-canonical NTP hydrolase)